MALKILLGSPTRSARRAGAWGAERRVALELCGFRGRRVGGAGFSEAHALIIVTVGAATCEYVSALAECAQDTVRARCGIAPAQEPVRLGDLEQGPCKGAWAHMYRRQRPRSNAAVVGETLTNIQFRPLLHQQMRQAATRDGLLQLLRRGVEDRVFVQIGRTVPHADTTVHYHGIHVCRVRKLRNGR